MKIICPQPNVWNRLYERMCTHAQKMGAVKPPVPLILAGWSYSSDEEKQERWEETCSWSATNACEDLIGNLEDQDWYRG